LDELKLLLPVLSSGKKLSSKEAKDAVAVLESILRSEDVEYEWDDAWDSSRYFCSAHAEALPYLCVVISDRHHHSSSDLHVRLWAISAAKNIGTVTPTYISALKAAAKSKEVRLRQMANIELSNIT
jgi:hypothetical protein